MGFLMQEVQVSSIVQTRSPRRQETVGGQQGLGVAPGELMGHSVIGVLRR